MAKAGQRKCMSCGEFFLPDHRSGERQRYCCTAACRRASKAASQARWLANPSNTDYFSGPPGQRRHHFKTDAKKGGTDDFLDYLEGSSCFHTRTGFEPCSFRSSWASGSA